MRDLPTGLWVAALLRRAELGGAFGAVLHKGDPDRGDVLLRVAAGDHGRDVRLYGVALALDGAAAFERLPADPAARDGAGVDAYVERRRSRDRDLWVVEIEDRAGRHFLTENVRDS